MRLELVDSDLESNELRVFNMPKQSVDSTFFPVINNLIFPRPNLKFNSGMGAILCNSCGSMYRCGLTHQEFRGIVSSIYCDDCKGHQHNPIGR